MESYVKSSNTKRFVVEDSITKVTSDGEPHEMMTMIAVISGLVAAMVILTILASVVGCKKRSVQQCRNCAATTDPCGCLEKQPRSSPRGSDASDAKRSSIAESSNTHTCLRVTTVAVIQTGNLEGNLNAAFVGSELNLSESLHKPKKKTHWSDEIEQREAVKETTIEIERF